jgi:serine/threonine-protein kinase SRPK3
MPRANFLADLSVRNLAFNSTRLSHLTEEELFRVLGLPKSEEVIRLDGKPLGEGIPNQLVKSTEWIGWPDEDDEDDEDIRIIDLGEAFTQDTVPESLAQPGDLQAPETIFTDRFDYRLDLWRAGLIVRFPPFTL